ncbi:hypothetical protein HPB47_003593 [Ixodes persulcatus]|uniref:Uncharacterized protein n=1 Tax=Ixodes persulcatus TaxID=34615 RepID=A0AC60PJ23_IXOPE|nr:hypothetical protein HPB47_003593 [Ixodes persulcatus]
MASVTKELSLQSESPFSCRGKTTCAKCGQNDHLSDNCANPPHCVNCGEPHAAYSRGVSPKTSVGTQVCPKDLVGSTTRFVVGAKRFTVPEWCCRASFKGGYGHHGTKGGIPSKGIRDGPKEGPSQTTSSKEQERTPSSSARLSGRGRALPTPASTSSRKPGQPDEAYSPASQQPVDEMMDESVSPSDDDLLPSDVNAYDLPRSSPGFVFLICASNLFSVQVAWLRVESKTILTIHKSVITQNYRVHLSPSDRSWLLVIDGVTEADRGGYMCQVNTVPMRSQVGYLDVLGECTRTLASLASFGTCRSCMPPDIVGSESSSDVLVREGSNVTLVCRAKGYPAPRITWRREDGQSIAVGNWQQHAAASDNVSFEGDELSVTKVSRLHMGPYLCIASNGVPSPVSRRILLQVHFPPMIWIPNQLIGAPLGGEVVMDCNTEAFPMSINYWTLEGGDLIAESSKYSLNRTENVYKVHMRLRIRRIVPEDFGAYRCFAKNSLGSTEGSIRLYEGKLEVSGDAITKHQSFPLRPPISGPPKIQVATDSSSSCVAAFYLLLIVEIIVAMVT